LREEVRKHAGGEAAELHIVAPAAHTSRLQRLTGAVDEARAEAEEVAHEVAEAVEDTASVETEVGVSEPDTGDRGRVANLPRRRADHRRAAELGG
jgi:hypothetical protein